MINHGRTLLMNIDGDGFGGYPGDEYIPPAYRRQNLPTALDTIRAQFFGADPDRVMLNYRTRQLLALLHATELEQFLRDLDTRITYDPINRSLFSSSLFQPMAWPLNTAGDVYFLGETGAPDDLGRCCHQWNVDVISETTVTVVRRTKPVQESIQSYTISGQLSSLVQLPGSGLQFRFREGVGSRWRIETMARPERQLGQIEANLRHIGEPHLLTLFGIGSRRGEQEPWTTFYQLWTQHLELPYTLGGVILALIYYTERLRQGQSL
jgi:hypothetical protein